MNTFFKGMGKGVSDYGVALRFIFKNGMAWYFTIPIMLNIGLLILGFSMVNSLADYLNTQLLDATQLNHSDAWFAEKLSWLLSGTIFVLLKIAFFFLFAYVGGYIIVILMSPVLAYLSEETEKKLTGHDYPFDIQQLMRDVVRGVLLALRNMFLELLIVIALFIISLFPVIGWLIGLLSPFILFFVSSYFYGFSFTDYVNERQRLNIKQSVRFMKQNRGLITGNGLPFALVLLIPFIGVTLSGFVAIVSTVASVFSIKDHLGEMPTQKELHE